MRGRAASHPLLPGTSGVGESQKVPDWRSSIPVAPESERRELATLAPIVAADADHRIVRQGGLEITLLADQHLLQALHFGASCKIRPNTSALRFGQVFAPSASGLGVEANVEGHRPQWRRVDHRGGRGRQGRPLHSGAQQQSQQQQKCASSHGTGAWLR